MRVKRLLYFGLGIVAALLAAAAVVLSTVDVDSRFKALAAGAAEQATGRKLAMNGTVKLSLLPLPGLTLTDVALANAPWGSGPDMLRLGELSARVELLPLLFGRGLHIQRLLLKDVTLRLETDAQGRGNWEFGTPAAPAATGGGGFDLAAIGEVRLENLTLAWRDGRTGKTLTGSLPQLTLTQMPDGSLTMAAAAVVQGGTAVAVAAKLGALGMQPYPIAATVEAAGGKAVLQGSVAEPMAGRGLDLAVALDGGDLGKLAALAGVALPAKPYHLAAKLTGDAGGTVALTGLQASLGGSALAGELRLATTGARPKLTAQLSAKLLDLAELLPPPAPTAPHADDRLFSNDPLPLAALAGFDADARLEVAELRGAGMTLRNLAVQATLDDRDLRVASFAVDLPEGHTGGKAAVSTRQTPASVEFSLDAKGLDFGALLTQLAGTDLLAAKGDVAVAVTGRGSSVRAIMASLNGTASLEAGHGIIRSRYADLIGADVFREAFAWARGKNDVALNCVVARFDISGGTATARALLLDSDLVTMSGSGTINLGTERLALELVPKPKDTSLLNLATPIDVGGQLNHPTFAPNRLALAKNVAIGAATVANPLFALVPMVLDSGGDRNACTAAVEGKPAARGTGAGGAVQQLNKTLKNLLP